MHNVYTIRGAKVRDALAWSKYINETLDLYPDAEVAFASHHWPTWGKDNIRQFMANQRDTYRFMHDRALNLANKGETMDELGNATFFPKGLAADASSHGYYGTLSHNLRAVYNFYLGFYDANPATPEPAAASRIRPSAMSPRWAARRRCIANARRRPSTTATTAGWPKLVNQRRLRQPEQRRGARVAAGRHARAAGLPVRSRRPGATPT